MSREGLITVGAFVGLFSCVKPLMIEDRTKKAKGRAAVLAHVRFLTSVDSLMSSKAGILSEGFSTLLTLVGLLSGVYPLML